MVLNGRRARIKKALLAGSFAALAGVALSTPAGAFPVPSYALVPNQSSATMKLQGDINVSSSAFLGGSGIVKAAHFVGGTFTGDGQGLTGVSSAGGVEVTDPVYGAVCDGVTDDSNAVQACVTGSAVSGKPCIIPPGKVCAFGDLSGNPHAHLDVPLSAKLSGPGTLLLNTDGGGLCTLGANGDIRIAQGNGGIRFENITFQAGSVPGYSCLLNASTVANQIGFLHLIRVSFNGSTGGPFTTGIVLGNVVNSEMVDGGFDGNFMGEVTDVGSFTNVVTVRDVYFEKLLGSATQYYQLQIGHNHGGLNLEISHNTFEVGPNSLNIDGGGQVLNNYMSDPVGGLTGTLITADGNPGFSGGISNNFLASEGGTVQIDGLHLHGNSAVVAGNFMDSQQTTILLTGSGNVVQGNYLYGPPHVQGIHVSTGSYNLIGPNQYFQNGSNPEEVCDSSATLNHIVSATSFQTGNGCDLNGNVVENLPNSSLHGYSSIVITASTTTSPTPLVMLPPPGLPVHGTMKLPLVTGPGGLGTNEEVDLEANSCNFPDDSGVFPANTYYCDMNLDDKQGGDVNVIVQSSVVFNFSAGNRYPPGQITMGFAPYQTIITSSGSIIDGGTLTVKGNAFSVGGSSFTVTGGSATVSYSMTAGSFSGKGSSLTNLTAANISAGSLGAQVIASSLAVNGVSAGTYGSGTSVAQIAVGGDGRITSASNVSIGTIGVPAGGTGDTSLTAHGVVIGEGTSNLSSLPALANGGLIIGAGTGVDPATGTLSGNAAVTVANGGGTIALSLNSSSATLQGNTFNGASQLVQLNSLNQLSVAGSAFSVGGSSFTVTGGSATVAYQLTAGSINLTGPVGNITSQSSVTASEFFGSGAGLTGISGGVSGLTPGAVTYGATSTTLASGPANMTASSTTFTAPVLFSSSILTGFDNRSIPGLSHTFIFVSSGVTTSSSTSVDMPFPAGAVGLMLLYGVQSSSQNGHVNIRLDNGTGSDGQANYNWSEIGSNTGNNNGKTYCQGPSDDTNGNNAGAPFFTLIISNPLAYLTKGLIQFGGHEDDLIAINSWQNSSGTPQTTVVTCRHFTPSPDFLPASGLRFFENTANTGSFRLTYMQFSSNPQ